MEKLSKLLSLTGRLGGSGSAHNGVSGTKSLINPEPPQTPLGSHQVLGLWIPSVAFVAVVCACMVHAYMHEWIFPSLPLMGPSLLGFTQLLALIRREDKEWEGKTYSEPPRADREC